MLLQGFSPLRHITPHSLERTYFSILLAKNFGDDGNSFDRLVRQQTR